MRVDFDSIQSSLFIFQSKIVVSNFVLAVPPLNFANNDLETLLYFETSKIFEPLISPTFVYLTAASTLLGKGEDDMG